MRRSEFFLGLALILLLVTAALPQPARGEGLKITEMAVTTKISRGNPIDAVRRISYRSVKALYCFTRLVSSVEGEISIKHVWYKDGEAVGETVLPVRGERWRTYSKRDIGRDSVGSWRVEALDSEGHLLRSVEFRIN